MRFSKSSLLSFLSVQSTRPLLRFTQDGTFQISIFEDLHYGEAEDLWWGPQQDLNTTRVMNSILDHEKQQLVVLNGDLITGENTFKHNSTDYIDRIVKPLLERNIPWASTYGNHDSQFNLSRQALLKRENSWPNSLTQQMVHAPSAGISNYFLPVYPFSPESQTPALILYFFDSRGGNLYQTTSPSTGAPVPQSDWVDPSVVTWFRATQASLKHRYNNLSIPSLAFVHIPVNAMLAFQVPPSSSSSSSSEGSRSGSGSGGEGEGEGEDVEGGEGQRKEGVDPNLQPGINNDLPLSHQGSGNYSGQDLPFTRALLETSGLLAVFSGHDHGNDWCFRWDGKLKGMTMTNLTGNGLDLCFGRRTGYGGYGDWARGSRQVRVSIEGLEAEEKEVETWVRLEGGEVTGKVTLNGTYGVDWYPAVPDEMT